MKGTIWIGCAKLKFSIAILGGPSTFVDYFYSQEKSKKVKISNINYYIIFAKPRSFHFKAIQVYQKLILFIVAKYTGGTLPSTIKFQYFNTGWRFLVLKMISIACTNIFLEGTLLNF